MADSGSILVTGAAGQLGAVGRTVTGLLLDRGLRFPVVMEKFLALRSELPAIWLHPTPYSCQAGRAISPTACRAKAT